MQRANLLPPQYGLVLVLYTSHASQLRVRSGSSALLRSYAGEIGGIFVETSAKSGINVQEMFTDISETKPPRHGPRAHAQPVPRVAPRAHAVCVLRVLKHGGA